MLNELHLAYNYLTAECLPYFAALSDPEFVRLETLNLSYNALGPDTLRLLQPMLGSVVDLNLANTKLTNTSMIDLHDIYRSQAMKLRSLDLASNQITAEGFRVLMLTLKTTNKVRRLDLSRNPIMEGQRDKKAFRALTTFLTQNAILDELILASCGLDEEAVAAIARGLRGNMNLQTLVLRDNHVAGGLGAIAKAFSQNRKGLCLKHLDFAKCWVSDEHIDDALLSMLMSPLTTLKTLHLRDNLLKQEAASRIEVALETNRSLTKVSLDNNPIARATMITIDKICRRNQSLDEIEQKRKNVAALAATKARSHTNRQALRTEINDLKRLTDETIEQVQDKLTDVEGRTANARSQRELLSSGVGQFTRLD